MDIELNHKSIFKWIARLFYTPSIHRHEGMKATGNGEGEDSISPKQLAEIIRNKDVRSAIGGKEYLLIIKEQANHRCSLFASDCEQCIWTRPLDMAFFLALRKELHLVSSLAVFAEHFVKSLCLSPKLERLRSQLKITINMKIGQGILLASQTSLDSRVHANSPDEFRPALRRFMIYLWQVKSAQLQGEIDRQAQERRLKEEKEKVERENERSSNMFVPDKKIQRISLKHRDLVNPQRKKRKKNGARLGSGFDEYKVPVQMPQDFDI